MRLLHTPYDGSSNPFSIGLKPLDLADWIEVGPDLGHLLAHKARLQATTPATVFVEEQDTRQAQQEALDLLVEHLLCRFPAMYRREAGRIRIEWSRFPIEPQISGPTHGPEPAEQQLQQAADHTCVALAGDTPPLLTAARLVGEDLILMRRNDMGWRLVAGSLSFPSSWSLREKFGHPLQEIHAPVPQFGRGTRAATLIERIFDNLAVEQPVQRWNWSLQPDAELHLPFSLRRPPAGTPAWRGFEDEAAAARAFIRVERQTLRRLPASRDILFTIRIHLDPLAALKAHPERASLAAGFARQLASLDAAQLDYKGLTADRDRLLCAMRAIGAA